MIDLVLYIALNAFFILLGIGAIYSWYKAMGNYFK